MGKPGRPSGRPGKKRGRTCRNLKHQTGFKAQRKKQQNRKMNPRFQPDDNRSNGSRCTTPRGMATSFAGLVFGRAGGGWKGGPGGRARHSVRAVAHPSRSGAQRTDAPYQDVSSTKRSGCVWRATAVGGKPGDYYLAKQFHSSSPGKTCRYGAVRNGGWRP